MLHDISPAPISEPSFFILLSLASGPRHGYAVLKDAEALSEGRVTLSVSTLYTSLGRLQEQGLIERMDAGGERPGPGLPRKVYRLTRQGQETLEAEAVRLQALLAAYHRRLGAESK
jgi:PadR family transcriptional regulator PadR